MTKVCGANRDVPTVWFAYGKGEEWGVYELPETEKQICFEKISMVIS